jgi:hypothetical protein
MFDCFKKIAHGLGFTNLSIAATGMDHSQALRNAAKAAGVENVVDCYVHVDRGMMKNRGKLHDSAYIEAARSHIRMLAKITDKAIFDRGMDIVLAEWRCQGEHAFADWFESVYLAEDWEHGSFHAGAGGFPGIPNHNQCDESLFRAIKRVIRTKATVEYFFERSVPDMLAHLDLNFSFDAISRGVENQQEKIKLGHIHRDIVEKALEYCRQDDKNIYRVKPNSKLQNPTLVYWYVNSSAYFYLDGTDENAVTMARVSAFRDVQRKNTSVEEFRKRHCSLHEVLQYFDQPTDRSKFRLVCDCAYFWSSNNHCSHVVAIYHQMEAINVFDMMSTLAPVRKRGRPTTREKALEHDHDLERGIKHVKATAWLQQDIRHPVYKTGQVYDTRTYVKPDGSGELITVWNVTFQDAPGGVVDYEMEEEDLMKAIKLYTEFKAMACKITKEPRIDC